MSNIYSRVAGRYGTLGGFYPTSGMQESLSENNAVISMTCYNTKLYTTSKDIHLKLPSGIQTGQLKKIVFVFKTNPYNVSVSSDYFIGDIQFKNQGDYIILMWTGGVWNVIETGNTMHPDLPTPWIQQY